MYKLNRKLMNYTVENYSVLLDEESFVDVEFIEKWNSLKSLFNVSPEELTLTTSEDCESIEDYGRFNSFIVFLSELKQINEIIQESGDIIYFVDYNGIKIAFTETPFNVIFLKVSDKLIFEKMFSEFKV